MFPEQYDHKHKNLRHPVRLFVNELGEVSEIALIWMLTITKESFNRLSKKQLFAAFAYE